jgi:hypothetical protein
VSAVSAVSCTAMKNLSPSMWRARYHNSKPRGEWYSSWTACILTKGTQCCGCCAIVSPAPFCWREVCSVSPRSVAEKSLLWQNHSNRQVKFVSKSSASVTEGILARFQIERSSVIGLFGHASRTISPPYCAKSRRPCPFPSMGLSPMDRTRCDWR